MDPLFGQTPCYVFDESLFRKRVRAVSKLLGDEIGLCYSIKANPFLLQMLPEEFSRIEVCSPGELAICERLGLDMKKVVYSGVNKSAGEIKRALDDGAGFLTAESRDHYEAICRDGRPADIFLRLTSGNQFGMDAGQITDIIAHADGHRQVRIRGIHFFSGTMKKKPAKIVKELARLEDFLDRLKEETGWSPQMIEYGTGLGVDYFPAQPDIPVIAAGGQSGQIFAGDPRMFAGDPQADEAELARLAEIAPALKRLAERAALTVEMGRFFAAPCGFYLSRVCDRKINEGINYAILDGGIHQIKYDGQIQGMQIPELTLIKEQETGERAGADPEEKWTLCGSLCTVSDVLARDVPLPGLSCGDVLAFGRCGAYSVYEGMSLFLSRDIPPVYLRRADGSLECVRARLRADELNCLMPD